MHHNYKILGAQPISIVVEMGLGSCISEWLPVAMKMAVNEGVLLYERAGINKSEVSTQDRTPLHIAEELYALLQTIDHQEKILIIAHSQGGLYAQQFCRKYPDMVKGVILLDPLSANDCEFKEKMTEKEYKMSGVDKSLNFKIMYRLARMKLGAITKRLLRNAPPLYYYKEYSKEEMDDILNCAKKSDHAITSLREYELAHDKKNVLELTSSEGFPDIPLVLVTHSSTLAVEESLKFGNNTREFAEKVENMWQDLMKEYLTFSKSSIWMQTEKSTHYIHLLDYDIVSKAIEWVDSNLARKE